MDYHCKIGFSNMSHVETMRNKKLVENFLSSFHITSYEMINSPVDGHDNIEAVITIPYSSLLKLHHATTALMAFCSFHCFWWLEETYDSNSPGIKK